VLNSVDEKLKSQGIDPTKMEMPVPVSAAPTNQQAAPAPGKNVQLDSRLPVEKGPLFLEQGTPQPPPAKAQPEESPVQKTDEGSQPPAEPSQQLPSAVVKGAPPRVKETGLDPRTAKPEESAPLPDAFDQIRQDAESLRKALSPLNW